MCQKFEVLYTRETTLKMESGIEMVLLSEQEMTSPNTSFQDGDPHAGENASAASLAVGEELTFSTHSLVQVIIYCILFVIAGAGNVPVFVSLLNKRHRKSRIKLMILHLAIADLIVTFVMIPLEVAWRLTVQWAAGNVMCKLMQMLRAFGPYLSSMVLVCISVDRYYAVLHPLKVHSGHRRGRIMLTVAWYASLICSIPQAFIFHVMEHPARPGFYQCVTFASFPSPAHEKVYNLLCLLVLYGGPLAVIVLCYTRIFWEIQRQSREGQGNAGSGEVCTRGRLRLRRSDMRQMQRARNRTLRLTIIIVLAFFLCWTPYVTMVLWYQIDPSGAEHVNGYLQSSLFMFAVSNSCVNPLVYGSYTKSFKRILAQVDCWLCKVRGGNYPACAKISAPTPLSQAACHTRAPALVVTEPAGGSKQRCLLCAPPIASNIREFQLQCYQPAVHCAYASVTNNVGDSSVLWKARSYSTMSHRNSAVTVLQNGDPERERGCRVGRSATQREPCSL
ncbi:adipokinetic hormone/corazonin-related peptide receptor variant I-like [Dermacentor andersoni]|uniref:adipokinetic hormone/corazonin-related peptide receptor variant I-like n=1 Tax=Dermacentor andersoni TaxID=34620 RepID=UPI003B3AEB8D